MPLRLTVHTLLPEKLQLQIWVSLNRCIHDINSVTKLVHLIIPFTACCTNSQNLRGLIFLLSDTKLHEYMLNYHTFQEN